jgi:hypothetical protein
LLHLDPDRQLGSVPETLGRASATVSSLERKYHTLEAQYAMLESLVWLDMQARQFGMMFPGEGQYFVRGLPNN